MSASLPDGRRVVVDALGDDPLDALERWVKIEAMSAPDPATLGPRDVVVRVRSASINWVDLLMTSGQYQHVPPLPYTPGLEYAGEVVWRGPDVNEAHLALFNQEHAIRNLTGITQHLSVLTCAPHSGRRQCSAGGDWQVCKVMEGVHGGYNRETRCCALLRHLVSAQCPGICSGLCEVAK